MTTSRITLRTFSLVTCVGLGVSLFPLAAAPSSALAASAPCALTQTYGRMLPNLPSASWSREAIDNLSLRSLAAEETDPTPEGVRDQEENADIPAGYTYFGQFVDHDITFDDRSNDLLTPTDPSSLRNARTPQLDLDSVYGNGPSTSSSLYQADGMRLLTGSALTGSSDTGATDVPRSSNGQALLGDPRNDENRVVAGIHSLFIRFHNTTVDHIKATNPSMPSADVFTAARAEVVARYQEIIMTDYLPVIAGRNVVDAVARKGSRGWSTNLRLYNTCAQMPVEFSVAAYRFGHSMVRGLYRINTSVERLPVFSGTFGVPGVDLTGFSSSPSNFGIEWGFFIPGSGARGVESQLSYNIDGSITHSLSLLPLPAAGTGPTNLASRNLLRGEQLGLPSGQDVARALGVPVLRDDQILVGKAVNDDSDAVTAVSVSPEFAGKTPLWTYILAESTAQSFRVRDGVIVGSQRAPFRLGPVGARIVTETLVGLLKADPASILNKTASASRNRPFSLRDFVKKATEQRVSRQVAPPAARGRGRASEPSLRASVAARPTAPAVLPTRGTNVTVRGGR